MIPGKNGERSAWTVETQCQERSVGAVLQSARELVLVVWLTVSVVVPVAAGLLSVITPPGPESEPTAVLLPLRSNVPLLMVRLPVPNPAYAAPTAGAAGAERRAAVVGAGSGQNQGAGAVHDQPAGAGDAGTAGAGVTQVDPDIVRAAGSERQRWVRLIARLPSAASPPRP